MTVFDDILHSARTRRICKDPANGLIFGVAAGIAWWLSLPRWVVRGLMILMLLWFTTATVVFYAVAALLLDTRKAEAGDRYTDFLRRYGRG